MLMRKRDDPRYFVKVKKKKEKSSALRFGKTTTFLRNHQNAGAFILAHSICIIPIQVCKRSINVMVVPQHFCFVE